MRLLTLLAVASLLAGGCTEVQRIPPADASTVTFKNPGMSRPDLKESRLAVLPIAATSNEGFRRAAAERLCVALEQEGIAQTIVRPDEVQEALGEGGFVAEVDALIAGYERTGLVDKAALNRVAEATGCRYLLTTLADSKVTRDDYVAGATHRASVVASASFQCRLWDAAAGDVVWEGEGAAGTLTNAPHHGTHQQALDMAAAGLARRVGKSPSEVFPPRSIDNLHAADQDQHLRRAQEGETALNVLCGALYVAGAVAEMAH